MAPKKAESDLTPNEATKTINFPKDGALLRRVQALAEKSRDSLNKTCLALIERGLDAVDQQATAPVREELAGAFGLDGAPAWLQMALHEAAKLTGLGIKGTLLDFNRRYVRDYLEVVRSESETLIKFLSNPPALPSRPDSLSK